MRMRSKFLSTAGLALAVAGCATVPVTVVMLNTAMTLGIEGGAAALDANAKAKFGR